MQQHNTFSKTHVSWGEKPTKQSDLPSPVFSSTCLSRWCSQPQRCTHGYFPCMCSSQKHSLPCKITMQSCQSSPPYPATAITTSCHSHYHHILSQPLSPHPVTVIMTTSCHSHYHHILSQPLSPHPVAVIITSCHSHHHHTLFQSSSQHLCGRFLL